MLRTPAVYAIEIATIASAAAMAFLLRFDFRLPPAYATPLLVAIAVWIPVKLAAFKVLGLDRRWARYVSLSDLLRLMMSNAIGSLAGLLILAFASAGVPRSVFAIDLLLCLCFTAGTRVTVRLIMESVQTRPPVRD